MKILGYSYYHDRQHFVMKCDSSLLNNSKPFFLPDTMHDVRASHCLVVRISRLGKGIQEKFAHRYYDAIANGIDFVCYDLWEQGLWTQATCFDGSLCVGEWQEPRLFDAYLPAIHQAIASVSQSITLRMGDLLYISMETGKAIQTQNIIENQGLYCKII